MRCGSAVLGKGPATAESFTGAVGAELSAPRGQSAALLTPSSACPALPAPRAGVRPWARGTADGAAR